MSIKIKMSFLWNNRKYYWALFVKLLTQELYLKPRWPRHDNPKGIVTPKWLYKVVNEFEAPPRGYGFAWREYTSDIRVTMPIPLNYVINWLRQLSHWCRKTLLFRTRSIFLLRTSVACIKPGDVLLFKFEEILPEAKSIRLQLYIEKTIRDAGIKDVGILVLGNGPDFKVIRSRKCQKR